MAAYVTVPRDLSKIKTKVIFNLTKRQLICFSIAAAIGIPSFLLIRRAGSPSVACICMIFIMMPMFLLAMYEKDGQYFEVIARHYIESRILRPRVRVYRTDNVYRTLARISRAEKEVGKIVQTAEKRKQEKAHVGRRRTHGKGIGRRRPAGLAYRKRKEAGRRDH